MRPTFQKAYAISPFYPACPAIVPLRVPHPGGKESLRAPATILTVRPESIGEGFRNSQLHETELKQLYVKGRDRRTQNWLTKFTREKQE